MELPQKVNHVKGNAEFKVLGKFDITLVRKNQRFNFKIHKWEKVIHTRQSKRMDRTIQTIVSSRFSIYLTLICDIIINHDNGYLTKRIIP